MLAEEQLTAGFRTGEWIVIPSRGVLQKGDREITPEPLVYRLLVLLASREGELISKDELIETLWDNRAMGDAPVNRAVTQLRKVLDDTTRPYRYIENVSKRGYRLKQPVILLGQSDEKPSATGPAATGWLRIAAAVILIAAAAGLYRTLIDEPPSVPVMAEQAIGVLPFEDLSPEQGNRYLVDGFKEELVNSLYTIPDLLVVNSRLAYHELELAEVAERLGVGSVLEGTVQRRDDRLRIFYKVSDASTGQLLLSGSLEGDVESHFELQSQLAVAVRDELLGESAQTLISRSRPMSFAAYDKYMRGLYELDSRQTESSLDDSIALFRETIELDASFGPAYVMLATAYSLLSTYRGVDFDEASKLALEALDRGSQADPSISDTAGAVRGYFAHQNMQWAASEAEYQRAIEARVVDPTAFLWYSRMLASVGRLQDSLSAALSALRLDPTSAVINSRVGMAYTWLGDYESARRYFDRADELGAGGDIHLIAYAFCLYRLGDTDAAREKTTAAINAAGGSDEWVDPVFAALADEQFRDEGLAAVARSVEGGIMMPQVELIVRAMLQDRGGALAVAERLVGEGEIFEMDLLFIPETGPLREHPGFDTLMSTLGLTEYWQSNGCAWQGRFIDCGGQGQPVR